MIPPKASYERLIAGGLAGAISRTCVAPFERLRTILMTESSVTFVQATKKIFKADGILGEIQLNAGHLFESRIRMCSIHSKGVKYLALRCICKWSFKQCASRDQEDSSARQHDVNKSAGEPRSLDVIKQAGCQTRLSGWFCKTTAHILKYIPFRILERKYVDSHQDHPSGSNSICCVWWGQRHFDFILPQGCCWWDVPGKFAIFLSCVCDEQLLYVWWQHAWGLSGM